jgi:Transposase IS116/IS110/IS902 family
MTEIFDTVNLIRGLHRQRRFAMKVQQKLDRSLESFLRINATAWNPNAEDADREKANREVKDLIKRIRAGEQHEFTTAVVTTDRAREPADEMREVNEKAMERAAKKLPVYPWLENIRGAGALGLATIIAETGDLSNYDTPAKLWKRLGYAPFDGHAGSTWKRETWRPRALSSEEWIENPFSGERYALMTQIATWLVNAQWIGAAKAGNGEGKPNGHYGEIYAKRRDQTKVSHSDWTLGHRRSDALRITMKAFLKDLWTEWRRVVAITEKKAA